MKASSTIFTHLQKPYDFMGIPMKSLGFVFFGLAAIYAIFFILIRFFPALMAFQMPALGVVFFGGALWLRAAAKKDHHIETTWILPRSFWGINNSIYYLSGGFLKRQPRLKKGGGK